MCTIYPVTDKFVSPELIGGSRVKVAIAQQNPVVGDIVGNMAKIGEVLEQWRGESPDLVVFPELFTNFF